MENTNRHIFSLSGITGMLIATLLLISILVGLTWWGIVTQQNVAQAPYKLKDPAGIKMINTNNGQHKVIVKE